MQVGKTKDQGLYNKPTEAVYPGALAAGTLPQFITIQSVKLEYTEHDYSRSALLSSRKLLLALQGARSTVISPMKSLEFPIDLIFLAAMFPWSRLRLTEMSTKDVPCEVQVAST